jgi:hypothetical protein
VLKSSFLKKCKFLFVVISLSLCITLCLYSFLDFNFDKNYQTLKEVQEKHPDFKKKITFPIDGKNIIVFDIPTGFKLEYNSSKDPSLLFWEFIPQSEDIDHWSKIITIQSVESLQIDEFFSALESNLHPLSISCNFSSESGVKTGYCTVDLISKNPQKPELSLDLNELLMVKAFETENRIWIAQYATRFDPKTITPEQRQKMVDEMNDFLKNCTVVPDILASSTTHGEVL